MPKPLSNDLRERVVAFVEAGQSRRAAAVHFRVSPSFVINLMTLLHRTGSVAARPRGGRRHAKLEPYRAFLLRRIGETPDITMPELAAELLASSGTKADPSSLSHWLIRNGYRYKKNPAGQRARQARHRRGAE